MAATVVAGNRLVRRWARIAEAPPVAEEARLFRGSAPIGGHGSGRESVGVTVGKNSRSAARCRKHPLQKICHCEASAHTGCGNPWYPRTAPLVLSPAGHFLPTAAENTQRTPPKPMVLESFARLECRLCGKFSATRTKCPGLTPCFRIVFAPTAAGRSRGPALAWRSRDGFCVYRFRGVEDAAPYTNLGNMLP